MRFLLDSCMLVINLTVKDKKDKTSGYGKRTLISDPPPHVQLKSDLPLYGGDTFQEPVAQIIVLIHEATQSMVCFAVCIWFGTCCAHVPDLDVWIGQFH